MKFFTEEWTLEKLLSLYDKNQLNLNPPYQRNDIWTNPSKRRLIDSIKKNYPLPVFFLHDRGNNNYDVVDGQQRTRAIYGFKKGLFKDLDNFKYESWNTENFDKYKISVTIINDVSNDIDLSDFYYRVNRFGTKLNRPEILKAQYQNTNIQNLINELADSEEFQVLNIFSSSGLNRMLDLDLIGELLGLIEYNITEKKKSPDALYRNDVSEEKAENLFATFKEIVDVLLEFNQIFPISNTRYKQRSDFFTLFGFIKEYISINIESLKYFYKLLVLIGDDITPSNEKSEEMSNYAFNCVSQSNSKKAREERMNFFIRLLLNNSETPNKTQIDILNYYDIQNSRLVKTDKYFTIDGEKIQEKVEYPKLF